MRATAYGFLSWLWLLWFRNKIPVSFGSPYVLSTMQGQNHIKYFRFIRIDRTEDSGKVVLAWLGKIVNIYLQAEVTFAKTAHLEL